MVSVLSPFFVSRPSLSCWRGSRVILTDDSPKCFNRNVLITGVVSHLHSCLDTHTKHGENRQPLSYMCVTLHNSHTWLLSVIPNTELVCTVDRVTGWPWWLDRPFYNKRIRGSVVIPPLSRCPWTKHWPTTFPQGCSSKMFALMYLTNMIVFNRSI